MSICSGDFSILFWYHTHDTYAQGLHNISIYYRLAPLKALAHRGYTDTLYTQARTTQGPLGSGDSGVRFFTPRI